MRKTPRRYADAMSLLRTFDLSVTSVARVVTFVSVLVGGSAQAQVLDRPLAASAVAAASAAPQAAPAKEQPSVYDRIWTDFTQWYKNDDNPAIQQVLFTGRFQHDFATVSADQGDHDESRSEERRVGKEGTSAGEA